jgi:hypothetical protein
MTRVLDFSTAKGTSRFAIIWQTLQFAQPGPRSLDRMRTEVHLLAKLETISVEKDGTRELRDFMELELSQSELDVITQYLPLVSWKVDAAAAVVDTADFLAAAERRE